MFILLVVFSLFLINYINLQKKTILLKYWIFILFFIINNKFIIPALKIVIYLNFKFFWF